MKKYLYLLFMLLFFFMFSCRDLPSEEKNISHLGLYSGPKEIIKILKNDHVSPEKNFLLGISHNDIKQYKDSILYLSNSCFKTHRDYKLKLYPLPVYRFVDSFHLKSDYYSEAVSRIAEIFFKYREYKYVVKFTELVDDNMPGLFRDAVILKARALSELKQNSKALTTLNELNRRYKDRNSDILIDIRIASVYHGMKRYKDSVTAYIEIIKNDPSAWQAGLAAEEALSIASSNGLTLTKKQILLLAEAFNRKGDFRKSNTLLTKFNIEKAELWIKKLHTRNLIRLGKKNQSLLFINKFRDDSETYYSLLKETADELSANHRLYLAIPLYLKTADCSQKNIAVDSLKKICEYYEDRRKNGYKKFLEMFCKRYPGNENTGKFYWLLGKNSIRDGKINDAKKYLENSVKTDPSGKFSDAARFWLYKISKNQKDSKSLTLLKDIVTINPDSSYTWILLERESSKTSSETLQKEFSKAIENNNTDSARLFNSLLFVKERNLEKRDIRIKKASALQIKHAKIGESIQNFSPVTSSGSVLKNLDCWFRIGYTEPVSREIAILPESAQEDSLSALTHFASEYGNYYLALNSLVKLYALKNIQIDISLMQKENLYILFPLAFKDIVIRNSSEFKVNPLIVLSIIKAESFFNKNAVSPAGATGLMQLMPATAKDIAGKLKIKKYDLKDEEVSIKFGSSYISWLKGYFKNNFSYMVAGYNAGAGNVNKWKKKFRGRDIDFFTEFIPFDETRYYILKTGKYLSQYKTIYGGN